MIPIVTTLIAEEDRAVPRDSPSLAGTAHPVFEHPSIVAAMKRARTAMAWFAWVHAPSLVLVSASHLIFVKLRRRWHQKAAVRVRVDAAARARLIAAQERLRERTRSKIEEAGPIAHSVMMLRRHAQQATV